MSDKDLSNIPGRITAPAKMLAPAIVELLLRIPETWQIYRPNDLSETQSQALFLLGAAGMVERRERMRMRMLGDPLVVEATITATGEYGGVEALMPLAAQVWGEWQDAFRRWREGPTPNVPPFHCERLEPSEWRLTDQGVAARKSLADGKEDVVVDFVLKRGFFDGRPRLLPDGRISQRGPVRGKGALVQIKKLKGEPPNALEIANWGEGAEAFAKVFAGLTHTSRPSPGAPTSDARQGGTLAPRNLREWANSDSGTFAVVITDIVASVKLRQRLGDCRMKTTLKGHFEKAASLAKKYHGFMFKTTGDGVIALFRRAPDALKFTLALEASTRGHFLLRAGIHVGHVGIDTNDCSGRPMDFTQRVMNKAKKGGVFVSDRAMQDIKDIGDGPRNVAYQEMPGIRLKGLDDAETLWQAKRKLFHGKQ